MKLTLPKPDAIGALASIMCMVHCLITPLLFIAQACSASCCKATPEWWIWIDYLFLAISFLAIYRSNKTTSNSIIKLLLWINWGGLFIMVLNEKLEILYLPKIFTYIPALLLIILHIYSLNYCQCKSNKCCVNH